MGTQKRLSKSEQIKSLKRRLDACREENERLKREKERLKLKNKSLAEQVRLAEKAGHVTIVPTDGVPPGTVIQTYSSSAMVEIGTLLLKYGSARTDLISTIARFDELAQARPGLKAEKIFSERLKAINVEMASFGKAFQNASAELGPVADRELSMWLNTVATIQDHIDGFLGGRIDGDELTQLYAHLPGNEAFGAVIQEALTRDRSKHAGRMYVGRRAHQLELSQPKIYSGKYSAQRAGKRIIEELRGSQQLTGEQGDALKWITGFESDKKQLGHEVSRAKSDWRNSQNT